MYFKPPNTSLLALCSPSHSPLIRVILRCSCTHCLALLAILICLLSLCSSFYVCLARLLPPTLLIPQSWPCPVCRPPLVCFLSKSSRCLWLFSHIYNKNRNRIVEWSCQQFPYFFPYILRQSLPVCIVTNLLNSRNTWISFKVIFIRLFT